MLWKYFLQEFSYVVIYKYRIVLLYPVTAFWNMSVVASKKYSINKIYTDCVHYR